MNRFFIVVIVFLIPMWSNCQIHSVKVYSNFLINSQQSPRHFDSRLKKSEYDGLSIAYRKENTNRLFHQIEAKIQYDKEDTVDASHERKGGSLRYDIGGSIERKLFKLITFKLGRSFRIFYMKESIDSREFHRYPVSINQSGITFYSFLNMEIDITKRIYAEFNFSVSGLTISVDRYKYEDPARTERQNTVGGLDSDFFIERILRLGIGFRI